MAYVITMVTTDVSQLVDQWLGHLCDTISVTVVNKEL